MPIRGENIGSAYVRIFGDGSSMPQDVRDALDSAEPSVRDAARDHGRTYGEEFNKEVRKSYKGHWEKTQGEMFKDMNDSLTRSLAKLELADRFFDSKGWKDFKIRLEDEGGDAGALLAKRLEEKFRDSGNLDKLADSMRDLGPLLRRAQKDLLDDLHADALRMDAEFDRRLKRINADMLAEAYQMDKQFDAFEREWRKTTETIVGDTEKTSRAIDTELERHRRLLISLGDANQKYGYEALRVFDREHEAWLRVNKDAEDHAIHLSRSRTIISKFDKDLVRLGDTTGRAFGRGSRNDFFNFIGGFVRLGTNLLTFPFRAAGKVIEWGGSLADTFTRAGGGMAGFLATLGSLGALAGTAVAGLAALVVGLAALFTVLGPVVALMSGLLGIVVALSGTVLMAVAAGLAAIGGAAVPALVGLGAVIGLIATMGPKIQEQAKVVKDAATGLLDDLHAGFFASGGFGDAMDQVAAKLESLGPLVRHIGGALRDVFDGWTDDLDSPTFDKFFNAMDRFLPGALRDLGRIGSQTLGGLAGLIRGLIPLTNDFLDWLRRITREFTGWANSREGQEQIKAFLRDAAGSARSLGGFLQEAGGFLADLIRSGNGAGDDMFDGMTRSLRRFRDYLSEPIETSSTSIMGGFRDPEHILPQSTVTTVRTRLDSWFDWAERLGEKIGEVAVQIGTMFDELDSDEARDQLETILDILKDTLEVINDLIDAYDLLMNFTPGGLIDNIKESGNNLLDLSGSPFLGGGSKSPGESVLVAPDFDAYLRSFNGLDAKIRARIGNVDVADLIEGQQGALVSLLTPFNGRNKDVRGRIGNTDVSDMILGQAIALTSLITPFNGSGGKVRDRVGQVNVGDMISNVIQALSSLINPFNGSGGKVRGNIGQVDVSGMISGADTAATNLVDRFRGLNNVIEGAIGTIVPIFDIQLPSIPHYGPNTARGGVFSGAQQRIIAEDGDEAVVPLDRPLSEVDPAVRWLSAIAQGLTPIGSPGSTSTGKTVDVGGITIVTPTEDPAAVARETVNQIAGAVF